MSRTSSSNNNSKLFIGGIPFNSKEEELYQYFTQFGSVKKVKIPKSRKTNKPRGFAFITFGTAEAALRALEKQHKLRGKKMVLRVAMKSSAASKHTKELQNLKIFARGFPLNTSEESIEQFFSKFGRVDRVLMGNSSRKESFKGFAYIIMKDRASFDKVLKAKVEDSECLKYRGISLEIKPAKAQKEISRFSESGSKQVNSHTNIGSNLDNQYAKSGSSSREGHFERKNWNISNSFDLNKQVESMSIRSQGSEMEFWKPRNTNSTNGNTGNRHHSGADSQTERFDSPIIQERFVPRNYRSYGRYSPANLSVFEPSFESSGGRRNSADQQYSHQISQDLSNSTNHNDLSGQNLIKRHHLMWRQSPAASMAQNNYVERTSHQNMNFTSFTTGGGFSNTSRPLPERNQVFGPQNAFGDNESDPNFMREGDNHQFVAQTAVNQRQSRRRNNDGEVNFEYYGPVFIPGNRQREGETEYIQESPTVQVKQTITTEYFVKNDGVIYHGTINETNIWGNHPHQDF